jgi:hypothetical protein
VVLHFVENVRLVLKLLYGFRLLVDLFHRFDPLFKKILGFFGYGGRG